MKSKTLVLITIAFITQDSLSVDEERVIKLPKKEEYKQLPPNNSPFFVITNSNTQTVNTYDSKKEVQTHIVHQPPPLVMHQPNPDPAYNAQSTVRSQKESENNYIASGISWLKDVPQKLFTLQTGAFVLGTAACAYGLLWIKLLKVRSEVKKNNGWGSFQEHIPPHHLQALPILSLAEGLLEEIKKKYQPVNAANIMPALLSFNKDVDKELEALTAFLSLCDWLTYLKLSFIFPDQKKLISQAQLKIQRLHLFKEALNQWVETHSARLMKSKTIESKPLTFSFESREETDEIELEIYAV
jgi:hypothetical protein